jgi:hypothetical protein
MRGAHNGSIMGKSPRLKHECSNRREVDEIEFDRDYRVRRSKISMIYLDRIESDVISSSSPRGSPSQDY